jgi:ABC-type antimicrobial peptide transport system, permease component
MFSNHLKIAWRQLKYRPGYAAINIGGLAVGMAVCLLMLLFVRQHWRQDRFHDNTDRIHRVTTMLPSGKHFAAAPPPVGPTLKKRYPGIEEVARLRQSSGALLRHDRNRFEELYLYAGPSFFRVFDGFDLAQGSETSALAKPNTAVLTSRMARKLFGDDDPMGQTVVREGLGEFTVTGVLDERPAAEPTHLQFEVIFSTATLDGDEEWVFADNWQRLSRNYTYLLLQEDTRPAAIEAHLTDFSDRFYTSESERYQFRLQSLSSIALGTPTSPDWNSIFGSNSLAAFIAYLLVGLGIVVLAAAAFNYVNLMVARSLRRTKEVGVRKAVGAGRAQVVGQFLSESLLVAFAATVGAALLLKGLVPAFKSLYSMRFIDPGLTFDLMAEPSLALLLLGFGATVGLLAGAYPAVVLSRPQATAVLRGGRGGTAPIWKGLWGMNLRKGLVGLQIVFAIVLTISTVLLYQQTRSVRTADHGFQTERVFTVPLEDVEYVPFKQQARRVSGVAGVTGTENIFMGGNHDFRALTRPAQPRDTLKEVDYFPTDSTFAQELDLNLTARLSDLETRYASGTAVILNRKATEALGFARPQAALGQSVSVDSTGPLTVAAVASGVWFEGRNEARIEPFALRYDPEEIEYALARVKPGRDTREVMENLESVWRTLGSAYPYKPRSYADLKQSHYGPMEDLSLIVGTVALIALLIVCLGVAALAAYTAQSRVKEIGIRKAVGADTWGIVRLLAGSYAGLLAGAAVVGVPLAWWLAARLWQPLFSRPLDPNVAIFAGSVVALGALVLAVVGTQAWQAAQKNPATALRDE